jgi:hypothetical protein
MGRNKYITAMIYRRFFIFSLAALILLSSAVACSVAKDVEERKNFMIPKKSEMPRNSRYREVEKRKTNHYKPKTARDKRLF